MKHNRTFRCLSPCRISLAGGGTDVSPFADVHGGAVVSASISKLMSAELTFRDDEQIILRSNVRPDPVIYESIADMQTTARLGFVSAIAQEMYSGPRGFDLVLGASVPARSGLGGSGAMAVSVVSVFNVACGLPYRFRKLGEIAEFAYKVEREMIGNPTGRQDQYAACFGGINLIEFSPRGKVTPFMTDGQRAAQLRIQELMQPGLPPGPVRPIGRCLNMVPEVARLLDSLLLFWVNQRDRDSGEIVGALPASGPGLDAMLQTKAMVPMMWQAVLAGDVATIGSLLDILWREKKAFNPAITNPRLDEIYDRLKATGIWGGKVTGAGAGGHMIACCPSEKREAVIEAAKELGLVNVPFSFSEADPFMREETN